MLSELPNSELPQTFVSNEPDQTPKAVENKPFSIDEQQIALETVVQSTHVREARLDDREAHSEVDEAMVEPSYSSDENIILPPVLTEMLTEFDNAERRIFAEIPPLPAETDELSSLESLALPEPEELLSPNPHQTILSLLRTGTMERTETVAVESQEVHDVADVSIEQPPIVTAFIQSLEAASTDQQEATEPALKEAIALLQALTYPNLVALITTEQRQSYIERLQVVLTQVASELAIELNETEAEQLLVYLLDRSSITFRHIQTVSQLLEDGTHEYKHQSVVASSVIFVEEHLHRLLGMLAITSRKTAV